MTPVFYTIVENNGAFQVRNGIGSTFDLEAAKDLPEAIKILTTEFNTAQTLTLEDLENATALQVELAQHSSIVVESGPKGKRDQRLLSFTPMDAAA